MTSGVYTLASTATDVIRSALLKIRAINETEAVGGQQSSDSLRQLNTLIQFLAAREGRHLWRRDEVLVFLEPSVPRYELSNDTNTEWCLEENFTSTKLNGAAAASATSLTVDSTAGIRAGDRVGIELTAGTMYWTSVTSVDSATTLTVPALPGAASDNAWVYTYTTSTEEVVKFDTLVNGALSSGVTTIVLDSTTAMADGDRVSYVDTAGNTRFTKITSVDGNGTDITVPATAAAIPDNALFNVYKTVVKQGSVSTKLNGAASANDEIITVDSTASMTAGDVMSVKLTDSSLAWMAIEHVISGTQLAIPPLPGGAADNNAVTVYRLKPARPLRVLHARRKENASATEVPIDIVAQELYRDQPLKTNTGTPVHVTYKPTLDDGRLEVWQPPSGATQILAMTVERPFEIFDATASEVDIPAEWVDPLTYLLADRLEMEYGILDPSRLAKLSMKVDEMMEWVNQFDDDGGSVIIQLDMEYGP